MSWSQRLSSLSGRWSPWARSPGAEEGSAKVNDGDYSYITADDLRKGDYDRNSGPPRDTDVLNFRNKNVAYPVHFPAYSIDRGELKVGDVREQAGRKIGCDSRRLKMIYKGKTFKDDKRTCREEGLQAGVDIMCIVSDSAVQGQEASDSDDDALEDETGSAEPTKRKRNRNRNKKKKGKTRSNNVTGENVSDGTPPVTPAAKPQIPATPLGKLNALEETLQDLKRHCDAYIADPPQDPSKRVFEYKRLGETILTQVLIKLDGVETEQPEERAKRKQLVREAQSVLDALDAAKP